ncbi:hypothetical protein HDU86_001453 [Geranomyces michiganensis]|nr:hypothetical protein HDU86_001453 [Geranomyces michiganensis]
MADISQSTFNHRDYVEIMEMVDKRLNDSGKNWRHVFKALTLLDYLLHTGSEAVITYAREHIHVIKTLKEFQYIDDDGKDQGANVRQKCKDITALLADETRLREERKTRADMRGRMTGLDDFPGIRGGASDQSAYYNEDRELQKALEESRRTARQDASRRDADKEDEELQRALELSEREAIERRMKERDQEQKAPEVAKKDNIIDFFGDLEESTPANPYAQQQQQPQQAGGFDPFAGFGGSDPFAQQQQFQQQLAANQQQQQLLQQQLAHQQMLQQQMQQPQFQPQQQQQQQANPFGGNPFGGAQMGTPVQEHLTGDNNALARGSGPIDPFANLSFGKAPGNATGGQSNPFGTNSDPFGGLSGGGGQQQASNVFGGLSANNTGGGNGQTMGMQNTNSGSMGGFGMGGNPQGLPQHNTGGPLGFGMGGGGQQQQGISQHNTGPSMVGGFGSGGFGMGQGISQHNTGGGLMGSGGGFGNQNMGISQHNTGNGGFGSPGPNRLVNLDPNSLGASSAFGAPAAKNPFQTSSGAKFQWENPKPAGPTLAQLATQNATNTAFGAPMQQQQQHQQQQQQQPFGAPFGGAGGGNAFGQLQQQPQQQPFGQLGAFGQQQPQQQMGGGMPFGQQQQQQQQQQQPFGSTPFGQQHQGGAASFF